MKLTLQNPDVLEADDAGYCMDQDGRWYRWKSYPITGDVEWQGNAALYIPPEDAPKDIPLSINWQETWVDNPIYQVAPAYDEVNKAKHYNLHPSGVECIEVIEHFQCNVAMAMKYLWRCDHKHEDILIDLKKAEYYIKREILLRQQLREAK